MDISELIKLASNNRDNIPQVLGILFDYIQNLGKNLESVDNMIKKLAEYNKKELTEHQKQLELHSVQLAEFHQQIEILQTWRGTTKKVTKVDNNE